MGLKHSRTSAFLLRCGLLAPRHPHCWSWAPREVVNVKLKWSELSSGLQVPPTQPGVEWAHPLPCQAHSLYEASDSFWTVSVLPSPQSLSRCRGDNFSFKQTWVQFSLYHLPVYDSTCPSLGFLMGKMGANSCFVAPGLPHPVLVQFGFVPKCKIFHCPY